MDFQTSGGIIAHQFSDISINTRTALHFNRKNHVVGCHVIYDVLRTVFTWVRHTANSCILLVNEHIDNFSDLSIGIRVFILTHQGLQFLCSTRDIGIIARPFRYSGVDSIRLLNCALSACGCSICKARGQSASRYIVKRLFQLCHIRIGKVSIRVFITKVIRQHRLDDGFARRVIGGLEVCNQLLQRLKIGFLKSRVLLKRRFHNDIGQRLAVIQQRVPRTVFGAFDGSRACTDGCAVCSQTFGHAGGRTDDADAVGVIRVLIPLPRAVRRIAAGLGILIHVQNTSVTGIGGGFQQGGIQLVAVGSISLNIQSGRVHDDALQAVALIRKIHQVTPFQVGQSDLLRRHRVIHAGFHSEVFFGAVKAVLVQQHHFQVAVSAHVGGDARNFRCGGQREPCVGGRHHHNAGHQQHGNGGDHLIPNSGGHNDFAFLFFPIFFGFRHFCFSFRDIACLLSRQRALVLRTLL